MQTAFSNSDVVAIERQLGRSLRVLHIGNIANNAYNNAKIQRQFGIEADVLCYDYYHVMAAPEWEDGGLTDPVDPALPNWWKTNLKGFKRPDWYVQGPLKLCIAYLQAYRTGNAERVAVMRSLIQEDYISKLRDAAKLKGEQWQEPRRSAPEYLRDARLTIDKVASRARIDGVRSKEFAKVLCKAFAGRVRSRAEKALATFKAKLEVAPIQLHTHAANVLRLLFWRSACRWFAKPVLPKRAQLALRIYQQARIAAGKGPLPDATLRLVADSIPQEIRNASWVRILPVVLRSSAKAAFWGAAAGMKTGVEFITRDRTRKAPENRPDHSEKLPSHQVPDASLPGHARHLLDKECAYQPVDADVRAAFLSIANFHCELFAPLLNYYDVVQGYSIDGIIPLVNRFKPFACYEHGTLREIPFENTLLGLQCRVAYRNAPAVFVTNTDVLPSVDRFALDPKCVHYLPHAFDDQKLLRWRESHAHLQPTPGEVVFFSPTRHHWKDNNPSLTKGNDVMLLAAGQLLAKGVTFRLVLVEWGQDTDATKALLKTLGLETRTKWVKPMGKQDLWRCYCTSHAVLDQFTLPALGGVGFETLALGRRLITKTDQPTLAKFFGCAPPVLAAADVEDVTASMESVINDAGDRSGIGKSGQEWIKKWHSARRVVEIQAAVYRELTTRSAEVLEFANHPELQAINSDDSRVPLLAT